MNNLPSLTYSFCFQKNMNLNSPPSHFHMHHSDPLLPNLTPAISYHFLFDPTQDHTGFYDHHHLYRPNHVPDYQNYGGSTYEIKNKVDDIGLKLGLWKKENDEGESKINNPMKKWMSSKMRVMQKMKHTDQDHDEKVQTSSSDLSSNSSSYNNSPIRVCSDCNTTKTPLWRSGPNGPKSLCNACGIRQRKARRALAAAAAAAANGVTANTRDEKIKGKVGKNEHATQLKKRFKTRGKKQLGFEDFLINMSKNLAFHRVFPDEEKDAAILLMALSSGLVNG